MTDPAAEFFPALELPGLCHAFIRRIPGLNVHVERAEALRRIAGHHVRILQAIGFSDMPLATAEQVHGNVVAVADPAATGPAPGADALVINRAGIALGIYVADCCPVYIVDPVKRAIGLAHSGKKGTELGIAAKTIETMRREFGSASGDLIVQLGPCIRPPDYEVDFAAEIVRQSASVGVRQVVDCGRNTAADLDAYYSYRVEKGRTGRMLAVMALV